MRERVGEGDWAEERKRNYADRGRKRERGRENNNIFPKIFKP